MTNSKRLTIKDVMEEIEKLRVKSLEVDNLKKRITDLENELISFKNKTRDESPEKMSQKIVLCKKCNETFKTVKDLRRHDKLNHTLTQIKCNSCEKVFHRNCDLERHLDKEHKLLKFECEKCDKSFVLKWRLIKHQKIHNSENIKKCHYFNNQKKCPFEQIGCMFLHLPAGKCGNVESCNKKLCSYEHENINVNEEDIVDNSVHEQIGMTDEERSFDVNVKENYSDIFENFLKHKRTIQCYYCSYRTKSKILRNIKDEVNEHLKVEHREVINTFENGELVIENLLHAEFLELFLTD